MQGELFEVSGPVIDASRMTSAQVSWMDRFRITLRPDHLAVTAIAALVLYVLVFSFGVEKGKRFALAELAAIKAKQAEITKELSQIEAPVLETTPLTPSVTEEAPAQEIQGEITTVSTVGKYTIQVITFLSRTKADQEVERLKSLGHSGYVIPAGKFFHVCIDNFQNMVEAKEGLTLLKSEGLAPQDAYIRPLKGNLPA